jgi:hypothetical protein
MDKAEPAGRIRSGDWHSIDSYAIVNTTVQCLIISLLMVGRVAAAKSAGELGIMQAILRFQELVRNVLYILGPAVLILGFAAYLFSRKSSRRAVRGKKLIYGGTVLFALTLALNLVLNVIAWVVS